MRINSAVMILCYNTTTTQCKTTTQIIENNLITDTPYLRAETIVTYTQYYISFISISPNKSTLNSIYSSLITSQHQLNNMSGITFPSSTTHPPITLRPSGTVQGITTVGKKLQHQNETIHERKSESMKITYENNI